MNTSACVRDPPFLARDTPCPAAESGDLGPGLLSTTSYPTCNVHGLLHEVIGSFSLHMVELLSAHAIDVRHMRTA